VAQFAGCFCTCGTTADDHYRFCRGEAVLHFFVGVESGEVGALEGVEGVWARGAGTDYQG